MRTSLFLLLGLCAAAAAAAQTPPPVSAANFTPAELNQLAAPIALYPDPLVALILPAATDPAGVAAAERFLTGGGSPFDAGSQPWDASVQSLAHYPDVIRWLNSNPQYTQALGAAFAADPTAVMQAIQRLRAQALAAGTLTNTPEQIVVMDGNTICIEPAQADTIYVPQYDPNVVYDTAALSGVVYVGFGYGWPIGPWLGYDCDWHRYGIRIGSWQERWHHRSDQFGGPAARPTGRFWRPDPRLVRQYLPVGSRAVVQSRPLDRRVAAPSSPAPGISYSQAARSYQPRFAEGPREFAPRSMAPAAPRPAYSRAAEPNRFESNRSGPSRGEAARSEPARSSAPAPQSSAPASRSADSNRNSR